VIGLWTNHHAHRRGAGHDFLAFGLGDAASYRDQRAGTVLAPQATDIGIDLLRSLFADVASVQYDQIGINTVRRGGHPLG